jgi:FMN phosphatase YigB (HAD superfamily)
VAKRAVVDIDNTLWEFSDALYLELSRLNSNFPPPATWINWDIWEGYCSKEDFYRAIGKVHANQDRDSYLPYPEAKSFLLSLKENDYHITIASHRSPDHMEPTERWLERHGLVYDDIHLSHRKTEIYNELTDVVVDDIPQFLEKAVACGAKATGLIFPWNENYRDNGFRFYSSLDEVLSYILNS